MEVSDPIRVFTVLAAVASLYELGRAAAAVPPMSKCFLHFRLWVFNLLLFYTAYVLTQRWQPPWDGLQKYWPALLVAHGVLALFLAMRSFLSVLAKR